MVEIRGLAPCADAHIKQRVSAVLSSVETSDLRRKISPCLPSNPLISSPKKSPCVQTMLSAHKSLVEIRGLAPCADAHRKQRVSAVLSSVETSDLRRKISPCLPSNPLISSPKKSPCVQTMLSAHKSLVEIRGLEPLTYTLRTYRATNCAISPYDFI